MLDLNNINFGKNLVWFIGVVEDRMDPNFLGRVKVRCFNYHTNSRIDIPTEDLPWAMVMQSITSAGQTDVGHSPTGLVEGSWVIGIFLDGEEAQQPLVIGSLGGYATKPEKLNPEDASDWYLYGFKDVREGSNLEQRGYPQPPLSVRRNRGSTLGVEIQENDFVSRFPRLDGQEKSTTPKLARGVLDLNIFYDKTISEASSYGTSTLAIKEPMLSKMMIENKNISTARKGYNFDQPTSPYQALYPFNHVWETESGHILEFDDTPRSERIHEYHRSGTFREIHPDGKLITQTVAERYDFNESHKYEYVKGSKFSTYKQGYALLINSARLSGQDYDVKVCGSSNYNLTVDEGNFNIKIPGGRTDILTSSLRLIGKNELVETAPYMLTSAGNHVHQIQNEYNLDAKGMYNMKGGSVHIAANMNYSMGAGDNITLNAGHTVSVIAENTFYMLPFYAPRPLGIEMKARHGHIELNAQDGDTRISARPKYGLFDTASFTVTSALPSSIATLAQFQPSPELETHASHPGSIIGQTHTGYIYLKSTNPIGNIVLHTTSFNMIKLKASPVGAIEETGGYIRMTSTSTDIYALSRMNVFIDARLGVYSTSKIGTYIQAGTEVFVKAGTRLDAVAETGATIHTNVGVVQIGDYAAVEPAVKGTTLMQLLLSHQHLTPMGPTGPLDITTNPYITNYIMNSYCKKTFVF